MIQIFGTKKCKDTQKAIRFFKERKIKLQFIDLKQKEVSPGELKSILKSVSYEDLINTKSKIYEELGLEHISYDKFEKLLDYPELFITPIVRFSGKAVVGNAPETWKKMTT